MAKSFTIDRGRLTVETLKGSATSSYRTLWCYQEMTPGIGFELKVHYDWSLSKWVLDAVGECVRYDDNHDEHPLDESEARAWWESSEDEFNEELGVPAQERDYAAELAAKDTQRAGEWWW